MILWIFQTNCGKLHYELQNIVDKRAVQNSPIRLDKQPYGANPLLEELVSRLEIVLDTVKSIRTEVFDDDE